MYPADQLEVSYTEYDLLETVSLTYDFAVGLVLTKNGSTYGPESVESYEYRITHDPAGWQIEVQESGGGWTILDSGIECLITGDGNLTADGDGVEDQFVAEYDLTTAWETVRVFRESLCVWRGEDVCGNSWTLFYGLNSDGIGNDFGWSAIPFSSDDCVTTESFFGGQTGNQSTPVGSYDGTASITVTEV